MRAFVTHRDNTFHKLESGGELVRFFKTQKATLDYYYSDDDGKKDRPVLVYPVTIKKTDEKSADGFVADFNFYGGGETAAEEVPHLNVIRPYKACYDWWSMGNDDARGSKPIPVEIKFGKAVKVPYNWSYFVCAYLDDGNAGGVSFKDGTEAQAFLQDVKTRLAPTLLKFKIPISALKMTITKSAPD